MLVGQVFKAIVNSFPLMHTCSELSEILNGKLSTAYCSSGGGWWSDCNDRRYRYQRDSVSLCDNYLLGSRLAIMHGDLEF